MSNSEEHTVNDTIKALFYASGHYCVYYPNHDKFNENVLKGTPMDIGAFIMSLEGEVCTDDIIFVLMVKGVPDFDRTVSIGDIFDHYEASGGR